jgi:gluconate 5-dehydrogenase
MVTSQQSLASNTLTSLLSLKDKVAVVTGGGGWLGTPICEVLVELGAHIFVASRNTDHHKQVKEAIVSSGLKNDQQKIESIELNLKDEASIKHCFNSVVKDAGRIDILVNNAYSGAANSWDETTLEHWNETITIGLTGYYLCMQEAAAAMRKAGGGTIINVASVYGVVSPDFSIYEHSITASSPAYGAAKAGVIQLTKYAACALAKDNIRVNAVSFGPFPTEQTQKNEQFISELARKNPMGRIGEPWEAKGAIAFLATAASSYVTGQNLLVDGGWTAW